MPTTLRWGHQASLHGAISQSLLEPDFAEAGERAAAPDPTPNALFVAAKTLLGLQPAYAVAVVDQDGRLRFKETLRFRFKDVPDQPGRAEPDVDSARRLERLGALLTDRPVYAPDELSADLDGVREALSHALWVRSLCPLLARRARAANAAEALLDWTSQDFDAAEDPGERARFLLRALIWTPSPDGRAHA